MMAKNQKVKPTKKKQQDWSKTLSKGFIIFVLFICVAGFTLTMGFFSIFKTPNTVNAGDTVIADYTIWDESGIPIITSDRYVAQDSYEKGIYVYYTQPIELTAGALVNAFVVPVDAFYENQIVSFGLLDQEVETMNMESVGMNEGDTKTVHLDYINPLIYNITAEEFDNSGGNFSEVQVGMMFPLSFGYQESMEENATPIAVTRVIKVIEKTENEIFLSYGYDSVEMLISAISSSYQ